MGFLVVVFMPYKLNFYTTFPTNCGIGFGLGTATCLISVVG